MLRPCKTLEFRSRVIFLCASALESARILLNSKTTRFPSGLANSSGELGRNLMDHPFGAGANGTLPGRKTARLRQRRMASTCRAFVTSRTSIRSSCGVRLSGWRRAQDWRRGARNLVLARSSRTPC